MAAPNMARAATSPPMTPKPATRLGAGSRCPAIPPSLFEDASMEAAAKTWDPAGKWWINGGGGTPWDTITFDPDLNMVYIGTGNGAPWNRNLRSPAGGDNLYLASMVALNADTGKYVWHYQETPGDNWDYTSTQPMILADINIDGAPRKVILHAPKNGFFFVIDRTNGKFISAKNFVDVNWATGYDANGRPIEVAAARARTSPTTPFPVRSARITGTRCPIIRRPDSSICRRRTCRQPDRRKDVLAKRADPLKIRRHLGMECRLHAERYPAEGPAFGRLIAWDPVKQKEAWHADYVAPWNGGTLTTAGNLVFQGTADGRFIAYDATTGENLWETPTGTGVVAAARPTWSTACNMCRLRSAGAACSAYDRMTERRTGHGLYLCHRWQGAAAGVHQIPAW